MVFSFFALFSLFLAFSLICILFLMSASIVTMDQSQAMSDLRLISMFIDNQSSLEWSVRNGELYKGDIPISGNTKLVSALSAYLRPDTRVSFHVGEVPDTVESLAFGDVDPFRRLVFFLKKDDRRLDPQFRGNVPPPSADLLQPPPGPPSVDSDRRPPENQETYILSGGILHVIKSGAGKNIGWIQLERESLGQGMTENLVFRIFLAIALVFAAVILFLAYRIIFRLSEPVHRLANLHKEITVAKDTLEDISKRDPLTGLLNRRGFDSSLNGLSFIPDGRRFAVALFDLDDFKKINDTYGHSCGDYVLKEVSRLIAAGIRQDDIACRWGGEEFLVFYSGAEEGILPEIAERMRHSIAACLYSFEGRSLTVTATIGFSLCRDLSDFDACVKRADAALYRGKKEGKNRVVRG